MKKITALILVICIAVTAFTGCSSFRVEDLTYDRDALIEDFKDDKYDLFRANDATEKLTVSANSYEETFYYFDESYQVNCYNAYLESNPDIKFRLWIGGGSSYKHCESDFEYIYLAHYLEEYIEQNPTASHLSVVPEAGYEGGFRYNIISMLTEDTRVADIEGRIADLTGFAEYVKNQPITFYPFVYYKELNDLSNHFSFGVQLTEWYTEKIPLSCFNGHNYSSNTEFFYPGIAVWIAKNHKLTNFYSSEELEEKIAVYNSYSNERRKNLYGSWPIDTMGYPVGHYRVYRNKKMLMKFDDDYVDVYNKNITVAQLYNILSALNWESLEGTAEEFSFDNIDGERVHVYPKKFDTEGALYSLVSDYDIFGFTVSNDDYEYNAVFDSERLEWYVGLTLEASNPSKEK